MKIAVQETLRHEYREFCAVGQQILVQNGSEFLSIWPKAVDAKAIVAGDTHSPKDREDGHLYALIVNT